jgi:hypothetical protein
VILDARLPAILQGREKAADAVEQFDFGQLCFHKQYYATAARFSRDAFDRGPELAGNVPTGLRSDAARAAALAGCGRSKDVDQLNDKERACWRRQALDWLRQDLTWWDRALDSGNAQTTAQARETMQQWLADSNFADVRGRDALARLPEEERRRWERLWSDVDALLRRVSQP